MGEQRNGTIFLDIGSCCECPPAYLFKPEKMADISFIALVGNDARKVVADGYPLENVVTSDLHQGPFLCFRGYRHVLGTFWRTLITRVCRIRGPRAQALQDDAGDVPDSVRPGRCPRPETPRGHTALHTCQRAHGPSTGFAQPSIAQPAARTSLRHTHVFILPSVQRGKPVASCARPRGAALPGAWLGDIRSARRPRGEGL